MQEIFFDFRQVQSNTFETSQLFLMPFVPKCPKLQELVV